MNAPQRVRVKLPRSFEVEPGGDTDPCPLCGIHRKHAGYIKESCGEWFRQPGCFVGAAVVREGTQRP